MVFVVGAAVAERSTRVVAVAVDFGVAARRRDCMAVVGNLPRDKVAALSGLTAFVDAGSALAVVLTVVVLTLETARWSGYCPCSIPAQPCLALSM